jgi:hypothetical protein
MTVGGTVNFEERMKAEVRSQKLEVRVWDRERGSKMRKMKTFTSF